LLLLGLAVLGIGQSTPAGAQGELGPQSVVRRFCQLDGLGQRLHTVTWNAMAPLVEWPLEPVWDSAVVVAGYDVGPPRVVAMDLMEVEVRYSVVAQITPTGQGDQAYVERIVFRVRPGEGGWRIMGPPPAPHLFASNVDMAAARRAVHPGQAQFPTNSDFVWQMYRAAGWEIDYLPTAELGSGQTFRLVTSPRPGDLIVYLNDGIAYHVGVLDDETNLISATINAGILRTPVEAFAGEVQYLRLVQPPPPTPIKDPPPLTAEDLAPATRVRTPRPTPGKTTATTRSLPSRKSPPRAQSKRKSKGSGVNRKTRPTPRPTQRRNTTPVVR